MHLIVTVYLLVERPDIVQCNVNLSTGWQLQTAGSNRFEILFIVVLVHCTVEHLHVIWKCFGLIPRLRGLGMRLDMLWPPKCPD